MREFCFDVRMCQQVLAASDGRRPIALVEFARMVHPIRVDLLDLPIIEKVSPQA